MDPEIICIDDEDEVVNQEQQDPDVILVYEKPNSRLGELRESRRPRRNKSSVLHRPPPADSVFVK